MQAIDSFGRIAQYGGVYAPSETAEMYVQGFTLFGVKELLLAYMTDASPASFKMERSLVGKFHALCFQHFRQHLWDAIATFSLDDKNTFWTLAMKVLRWRGYIDDTALMVDIQALIRLFAHRNQEIAKQLSFLEEHREKLCTFYVSKVFTMMRIASSTAESVHSSLKGGGEFKRILRASNFYESLMHILQSMKIYLEAGRPFAIYGC